MAISERDTLCLSCKFRKFDLNEGLLCSITSKVADFEINCVNYINEEFLLKDRSRRKNKIVAKGRIKFLTIAVLVSCYNLLLCYSIFVIIHLFVYKLHYYGMHQYPYVHMQIRDHFA